MGGVGPSQMTANGSEHFEKVGGWTWDFEKLRESNLLRFCQPKKDDFTSSDPRPDTLFWHSFWHTIWKYV